jgi:hypothetical protein
MIADDDRCAHGLTGRCFFCERGLPAEPEPEPTPVVADDQLDDDPYSDDGLAWWQR